MFHFRDKKAPLMGAMEELFSKRTEDGAPLLFRFRISGNGLFLAISAPSVPFQDSFFQKTGQHLI